MWITFGLFVWTVIGFIWAFYFPPLDEETLSETIIMLPAGLLSWLILMCIPPKGDGE